MLAQIHPLAISLMAMLCLLCRQIRVPLCREWLEVLTHTRSHSSYPDIRILHFSWKLTRAILMALGFTRQGKPFFEEESLVTTSI